MMDITESLNIIVSHIMSPNVIAINESRLLETYQSLCINISSMPYITNG
jgi:hypothetical protein